jgi:hypothetical protein
MKIIGGRDYYDGAGFGVDEAIIFVRKEFETRDHPFDLKPRVRYHHNKSNFYYHFVIVAGKIYPAMSEVRAKKDNFQFDGFYTVWHYDVDIALSCLKNAFRKDDRKHIRRARMERFSEDVRQHFSQKVDHKHLTDWIIENRVVTGLVSYERRDDISGDTVLRANISTLSDLEFFRVLDPATIHMEISNFIGGVLPHSTETIELKDIDRIRKAGFDTKSSFRQDPGIKKPRRRRS